jgi:hypothetical protein
MKKSRLSFLLMLLMGAFTLTSCGDGDADTDTDTADSTADLSEDAGDAGNGGPADQLKNATFEMMEELIDISEGIESVEDVQEARPEIAAAMQKIVVLTEGMIASAASLTAEDQTALQNMQTDMQNDSRFKELNERATKAQADMTERSPEAAAEFQKVTQEEGMKMAQAMMTAMQEMVSKSMPSTDSGAAAAPADTTK